MIDSGYLTFPHDENGVPHYAMNVDVEVKSFAVAKFGIFVPPDTPLKGILVLTPGSNEDGRKDIVGPEWYTWARTRSLAVLGCYFKDHGQSAVENYVDAKTESGPALVEALEMFTEKYPQLKGLRLYLWGWSAGGQFNHEFNAHFPEKVGGFVVNKGGVYYTALAPAKARQNHGLYILGTKDYPLRGVAIRGVYAINVYAGARWVLEEEEVDHELGNSIKLAKQFFDHLLGVKPQ